MNPDIRWLTDQVPRLSRPLLLAAFVSSHEGSTAAALLGLLREQLRAQLIAEIDPDRFYDFTVARPVTFLNEAGERVIDWPENRFDVARVGNRDLVLFSGLEPHLHWRAFTSAFDEIAFALGVRQTIFLGTRPGPVPHTRPSSVYLSGGDAELAALFPVVAEAPSDEGPAGIQTVLSFREAELGRVGARLTALTPFYATVDPNPYGALALADTLARGLGVSIDLAPLQGIRQPLDERLRHAMARSNGFRELVANLEVETDRHGDPNTVDSDELKNLLDEINLFLDQRPSSGHGSGSGHSGIPGEHEALDEVSNSGGQRP